MTQQPTNKIYKKLSTLPNSCLILAWNKMPPSASTAFCKHPDFQDLRK